jgi:hypothetical protein
MNTMFSENSTSVAELCVGYTRPNKTPKAREMLSETRKKDASAMQNANVDRVFVDSRDHSEETRE